MSSSPQTFFVPTEDGWSLALHHFKTTLAKPKRHPILMLHGFGANRLCFHFDKRYSIVKAALRRGFEVYLLELRGAGLSVASHHAKKCWGFDDYNHKDLPAALKAVQQHSGSEVVHAIGHSMGGMLFYALGCRYSNYLRSISTLGSPLLCHIQLGSREKRLLKLLLRMAPKNIQTQIPLKSLFALAGIYVAPLFADGILVNMQNIEMEVVHRLAKHAVSDVPAQLIAELTHTIFQQTLSDTFEHERKLNDISAPVLVISGNEDRIAPPASVMAALERLGSEDVRYREFGVKHGDKANYGHIDLLIGKNAPDEVYPLVLDFVEEVD